MKQYAKLPEERFASWDDIRHSLELAVDDFKNFNFDTLCVLDLDETIQWLLGLGGSE
jgi:hypothetical protein